LVGHLRHLAHTTVTITAQTHTRSQPCGGCSCTPKKNESILVVVGIMPHEWMDGCLYELADSRPIYSRCGLFATRRPLMLATRERFANRTSQTFVQTKQQILLLFLFSFSFLSLFNPFRHHAAGIVVSDCVLYCQ
jgi:hypothetical protein